MKYKILRIISVAFAILTILTVIYVVMMDLNLYYLVVIPAVLAGLIGQIANKEKEKK